MFNLITEEHKKTIRTEYRLRLFAVVLFFFAFTGLVGLVFLMPSFLAVSLNLTDLKQQKQNLEKEIPELKDINSLEALSAQVNMKIKALNSEEKSMPTEIINIINPAELRAIKLKSISYIKNNSEVKVGVNGTATTRDALVAFSRQLETVEIFEKVNLPVSDLAKDRDINFSLTFSVIN